MARAGDTEVTVETRADGIVVARVEGELDLATSPDFERSIAGADPASRLVIDLSDCTFLDSSAVRVLAATARTASDAGGSVSLVTADPGVRRVLEIAAIDTVLPVHERLDTALRQT